MRENPQYRAVAHIIAIVASIAEIVAGASQQDYTTYHGMSDASAAVAVGHDMCIVADDENNTLRVYETNGGNLPVSLYDLSAFLQVDPEQPEVDIEGATKVGDRVYWISSHGRNKDGELRRSRYRFFATDVKLTGSAVTLQPVGTPCKTLVHQLVRSKIGRQFSLEKSTRLNESGLAKKQLQLLAPKEQGLNIEALAASPDGQTLWIGFRNPKPLDRATRRPCALVVALKNADDVLLQRAPPVFDESLLWDLDGLGIRSMEYSSYHKAFFIVAGPSDETARFILYRWSGNPQDQPTLVRKLDSGSDQFTPEALVPFESSPAVGVAGSPQLLLLSDDGSLPVKITETAECAKGDLNADGTCPNKSLTDPARKTFRSLWLQP